MVWEDGRQGGAPLMLPHKSLLLINVEKLSFWKLSGMQPFKEFYDMLKFMLTR